MLRRKRKRVRTEIHPDEILIDSSNIPEFDRDQFEGRIERALPRRSFIYAGGILALLFVGLVARAGDLQLVKGAMYAQQAKENQLTQQVLFADRGEIVDRNGIPLAYNDRTSVTAAFATRVYANFSGLAHVVGYVKPPEKDSTGTYFSNQFVGLDGAERAFDSELQGQNGLKLTETNALGNVVAQSVVEAPQPGKEITLSIDANVTQALYDGIAKLVQSSNFQGGAGVIMDVHTGQILALTSYPEYPQQAVEEGNPSVLAALNQNPEQPFLDRVTSGLYAPGSIVKPIVATGALTEGIISPDKQILSTGSISIPNPYDPAHPSVFLDWRPNGWVNVEQAIAVSSDVYFYEVGGGYQGQPGLGITKLDKYFSLFGFGQDPGLAGFPDASGNIPTPAWKALNFPNDPTWRLGDTYHTAIGQYGVQVTPLQVVLEAAAIANGGTLLTPTLLASSTPQGIQIPGIAPALAIVRQGMRLGVTTGIAQAINFDFVHAAAKTGTAQVGVKNQYENSSIIGFWPYENPHYAFAVILERAPTGVLHGAPAVMAQLFNWMQQNSPQYLQ